MYSSDELMDGIITELYDLFKALISGNYAPFCTLFADIVSKLAALRKGMKDERAAKENQIRDLEAQLKRATQPLEGGAQVIGGETTEYRYGTGNNEEG